MPKNLFGSDHAFLPRNDILSYEEIERTVKLFAELGVTKIRITGGEPLIRRDLDKLIGKISSVSGIKDISLTTNGALLTHKKAQSLLNNGLNRITLSLDALDNAYFKKINDVKFSVQRVLDAIHIAKEAGLKPVKVNMVVMNNINHNQILPIASYFRHKDVIVRFIEFMDVGTTNKWRSDKVFNAASIIKLINEQYPVEPVTANYIGEVARRWRYKDGGGEIGIIASVSQPFCSSCNRARLSAEGKVYTCLFSSTGYDLRHLLRHHLDNKFVVKKLAELWQNRNDRYSLLRGKLDKSSQKIEMSYIGG